MDQIIPALQIIIISIKKNTVFVLSIIALLLLLNIINRLLGNRLNYLGIIPRTARGLIGVFFSPFLHRDFNHLFFNSIPLFVLANLVLLNGRTAFYIISFITIALSGLGVWLFGRRAIHVGASGLIMGYFGYLLANVYFSINTTTIILGILCLYYFGGLVINLFPGEKDVSWEGHVFGFIAGIITAYCYPIFISFFRIIK